MLAGNLLMGVAVAMLRMSQMGTDPFTCMNLGVSQALHMQFGTYQLIVNCIIFVFVLWKGRHHIHLGTIVNMAGIGYIADFGVMIFTNTLGEPDTLTMAVRIGIMATAVVLCSFAAAVYMQADLGIAPYDAMGYMIEAGTRGKIPFKAARVATDLICVGIGFSFGSIVGVATVITAFFMGPLIQWFRTKWLSPLFS